MDTQSLATTLKVLGSQTRLNILRQLMEGIHCNCEIAQQLGLSLSLVSHHLTVLARHSLIYGEHDTGDARWIYYTVNQKMLQQLTQELHEILDVTNIQPRQPQCGPGLNKGG